MASDLSCVVHVHSTYSDGTATVPEIAAAARRAGADDRDTLAARREEGFYDRGTMRRVPVGGRAAG